VAAEHVAAIAHRLGDHGLEIGDQLRVSITRAIRGGVRLAVATGVVEEQLVAATGEQR
jgi:hypothetical protein